MNPSSKTFQRQTGLNAPWLARVSEHRYALVLFVLAGFLVFNFLDNQALWQDEGETAMLSMSVLRHGFPSGYYGEYLISPVNLQYDGYGPGGAWMYATWLPYYVTALSFYFFGPTTWAARFPFALTGFLSFILTYVLALKLFKEKSIALLSVFIMCVSVPTLLLFRQCRYYPMQVMFALFTFLTYVSLVESFSRRKAILFLASLVGFFYTTQGIFIPVAAWLGFDTVVFKRLKSWRKNERLFLISGLFVAAIFILPWYFFLVTLRNAASFEWLRLWRNFEFSIRMINKFIFPFLVNAILLAVIYFRRPRVERKWDMNGWPQLVLPFILINSVFFIFLRHRMMRYYVHLFPFYFMIQAFIFYRLAKYAKRWIVILLFTLVCFTDVFSSSGAKLFSGLDVRRNLLEFKTSFRAYFPEFLYEITHRYEGPVSSFVDYLGKHAKAGDQVKIQMYADSDSTQFYLPQLKILNDLFFTKFDFPDWIVPRDYWVRQELLNADPAKLPQYEAYLDEIGRRYERIVLHTYDIIWENRPDDIGYHKFRTVTEGPYPTMIYKKLSDEEYARRLKELKQEKLDGKGFDRKPLIPILVSNS